MRILITLLFSGLLLSCVQSPTGRDQIMLVSPGQMANLGNQSFEQMKKDQKVSKNAATVRYVRCVADNIVAALPAKHRKQPWEVVVFESKQVNAFALPGGKIGVYTGLLDVAQNQHQLATVVGHEVGHVLAQHGAERYSQAMLAGTVMSAANVALASNENKAQWMAVLGLGAQYGVLMPYGRAQESEADIMGLDLMARAGFDPQQSVALWRNMAKASKGAPPELLSTHPSHGTRIGNLQGDMPKAVALYNQAKKAGNVPACFNKSV